MHQRILFSRRFFGCTTLLKLNLFSGDVYSLDFNCTFVHVFFIEIIRSLFNVRILADANRNGEISDILLRTLMKRSKQNK